MKEIHSKYLKNHKCLNCEFIHCINLYKKDGKLEGGELFVLEECLKNKKFTLCEGGSIINTLCQFSKEFTDTLSFELFNQCIRDLKASTFLIVTGHYRTAIQILRPVIENWLAGLYWDFKLGNSSKGDKVMKEYEKFRKMENYEVAESEWYEIYNEDIGRKRYLNQEFILRWMLKKGIVDGKFKQKINKMSGKLNKYLHPSFPATDIKVKGCTACPASVKFSEKEYIKCLKLFQDTTILLLETFFDYLHLFSPDKLEDDLFLEETLGYITNLKDIEKDAGRELIISEEFKRFINEITA